MLLLFSFLIWQLLAIDFQGENGSKIAESRQMYNVSHHLETEEILIAAIIPYFINISSFSFCLSDLIFFLCSFLSPHFPFVFQLSSFSSAILRPLMSESKLSSPSQCVSSNSLNARFGCCNILETSLALRRKQWFAKCYFFFLVSVLPLKSLKLGFLPKLMKLQPLFEDLLSLPNRSSFCLGLRPLG